VSEHVAVSSPPPPTEAVNFDPLNGLSSEDISLSISLPSNVDEDEDDDEKEGSGSSGDHSLSSQEKARLALVRSGIFRCAICQYLSRWQINIARNISWQLVRIP
jgi:hypothetical protein